MSRGSGLARAGPGLGLGLGSGSERLSYLPYGTVLRLLDRIILSAHPDPYRTKHMASVETSQTFCWPPDQLVKIVVQELAAIPLRTGELHQA